MMAAGINPAVLFAQVAQQTGGGAALPVGPPPVQLAVGADSAAVVAGTPNEHEPKTAVLLQGKEQQGQEGDAAAAATAPSAAPVDNSSDPKPEEGAAVSV